MKYKVCYDKLGDLYVIDDTGRIDAILKPNDQKPHTEHDAWCIFCQSFYDATQMQMTADLEIGGWFCAGCSRTINYPNHTMKYTVVDLRELKGILERAGDMVDSMASSTSVSSPQAILRNDINRFIEKIGAIFEHGPVNVPYPDDMRVVIDKKGQMIFQHNTRLAKSDGENNDTHPAPTQ